MSFTAILAALEALMASPLVKPLEEAELQVLRSDLAGKPFLLMVLNGVASAAGL